MADQRSIVQGLEDIESKIDEVLQVLQAQSTVLNVGLATILQVLKAQSSSLATLLTTMENNQTLLILGENEILKALVGPPSGQLVLTLGRVLPQ